MAARPSRKEFRDDRETQEEGQYPENEIKVTAWRHQLSYIANAVALLTEKPKYDTIKVSGVGAAIYNVVNIAETVKRRVKGVHQITDISSENVKVPTMVITLSTKPLDPTHIGYQAPLSDDQNAALDAVADRTSTRALGALLEKRPSLASCVMELENDEVTTLLHSAVRHNNPDAIRMLLVYGADPNQQILVLSTPLHGACYCGHVECVEALMSYMPRTDNWYNETCLTVFRDDVPVGVQRRIRRLVLGEKVRQYKRHAFGYDDPNLGFLREAAPAIQPAAPGVSLAAAPQAAPAAIAKHVVAPTPKKPLPPPEKPLPPAALPTYPFPTSLANASDSDVFHQFVDNASHIFVSITNNDHPGGEAAICDAIDAFIYTRGCHADQLFALSNTPAGCTTTFLFHAIDHSRSEIARHLLKKHKATPGRQYPELGNDCALHRACYLGRVDVVRWLLEASQYNITELRNANNERCFDAFSDAVSIEAQREIEALCCGVVEGAAPAIDVADQTAALKAVVDRTGTRTLEALLKKRPSLATYVMELDDEVTTLLYSAARHNNPNAIRMLLKHGADPNQQILDLSTPLHGACCGGHVECVEALMSHTSPPRTDTVNSYNETCLTVFRDDVPLDVQRRIRRLVLADKARLFTALENDDVESFKVAFGYDDPNVQVPNGSRMVDLLLEAAGHMSEKVLQFLLSRSARNVNAALDVVCRKGNTACVQSLLNYGAARGVVANVVNELPHLKRILAEFLPAAPVAGCS